jgi:hypothetical protein
MSRIYECGPGREAIRVGWVWRIPGTRWHLHYKKGEGLHLVRT